MGFPEAYEIPPSGAVFTFGRSRFAGNEPSQFFIRNDPVSHISCGDEHTVLICEGGRAFAFGSNDSGQLGLGHNRPVEKPMCIKSIKPWSMQYAACGKTHTLLSSTCGKVFACGANEEGQLGVADKETRHIPVEVQIDLGGCNIVALAAGCLHSALLTDNGDIWTWGGNADGQCGIESLEIVLTPTLVTCHAEPASATSISCGYYHTAFTREDGVWTMGESENGKLGRDRDDNGGNSPQKAGMPYDTTGTIVQVAAGGSHTMVLTEGGKVYGFGSNWCGQIGDVVERESSAAMPVELPAVISHISCGESHTAFVTESGEVYTCGDARHGKLCRDGSAAVPELVNVLSPYMVKAVACGGCHTMILAWNRQNSEIEAGLPPLKPRPSIAQAMTGDSIDADKDINGDLTDTESPVESAQQELPPDDTKINDSEEIEVIHNREIFKTLSIVDEQIEDIDAAIDAECLKTATIEKPPSKVKKLVSILRGKPKSKYLLHGLTCNAWQRQNR